MRNPTIALTALMALFFTSPLSAQQVDVPEPTFMQPPSVQSYQIRFKGRDPFMIRGTSFKDTKVMIAELEYRGVIKMGSTTLAIFNRRGDPSDRYVLKQRKLYGGSKEAVDGVLGDITDAEVVLTQGSMKIPFPREQRRP